MVYSEQALKGMNKNDLVKLVVQLEQKEEEREQRQDDLTNEIREALKKFSMLEADLAVTKIVDSLLKKQLIELEGQSWDSLFQERMFGIRRISSHYN